MTSARGSITADSQQYTDLSALAYLCHFKISEAVPLVGSVSYEQVADACNIDELQLRRILRFAMTNNLFRELSPDEVAHTTYSAVLITDPSTRAVVAYQCLEAFPASSKLVEAAERWPDAEEPSHTAWSLANKSDWSYFEHISRPENEKQMHRFVDCMSAGLSDPQWSIDHTISGYDWKSVKGTVVDVGGNQGQTAVALASAFPHISRIVVQDLPSVVGPAEAALPSDLSKRISFQAHDFHVLQPAETSKASLFILRFVLHDFADKPAARIIRNIVPALKQGATLLIIDTVAPPVGKLPAREERAIRGLDVELMSMLNGKERSPEEWRELLHVADRNLEIQDVNVQNGNGVGIIEVVYGS